MEQPVAVQDSDSLHRPHPEISGLGAAPIGPDSLCVCRPVHVAELQM